METPNLIIKIGSFVMKKLSIVETKVLAESILTKHNLSEWKIEFSNRMKNCLGKCVYKKKTIKISVDHIHNNPYESILDTILHEVAHALTPGARHGREWQAMCLKIGAKPSRYAKAVVTYKYQLALEQDGEIILLPRFAHKKTSLEGRMLKGQKETLNKLRWVEIA